jgi:hypothetical protein
VTKTIRIPDEDYDKIREYAEKRDIPMSAALSQYLNVVEDLRGQLPARETSVDDREPGDVGHDDVDDWAAPQSVAASIEQPAAAAEEARGTPTGGDDEVAAAIEELTDRVATLESELETLAARVRELEGTERT